MSSPDLEPLADYLRPRFGDIYRYGYDHRPLWAVQPWTDELRAAVKQYLMHNVEDELYTAFLQEKTMEYQVPAGSRAAQADFIIAHSQPWEIANDFHLAALKALPSLDRLIGHRTTWQTVDQTDDTHLWLESQAGQAQLDKLMALLRRLEPVPATLTFSDLSLVNPWPMTPPQLLDAWRHVVGPTPSDLSDAEWQLLVPFLPRKYQCNPSFSARQLPTCRQALNGIHYRFAHGIPWSDVPKRYGVGHNLFQRHRSYKATGLYTQMQHAMQGDPAAGRLVARLATITGEAAANGPDTQPAATEETPDFG